MQRKKHKCALIQNYKISKATVKIIIFTRAMQITTLVTHLNQVVNSTLASLSPPIIAPHVGVNKLTNPLAATIPITVASTEYPIFLASGPIIGVDNEARPEDDGTNTDNATCIERNTTT